PRIAGRRYETAELPFKKFSKGDCRAIFEIRSDDLHPNRQTGRRTIDRRRGCWEATRGGRVRPHKTRIVKGVPFAVDLNVSPLNRQRMVVREGRDRGRRVEHDIPVAKEQAPLLLEPPPRHVSIDPIAMAQDRAAYTLGFEAVITGSQGRGRPL